MVKELDIAEVIAGSLKGRCPLSCYRKPDKCCCLCSESELVGGDCTGWCGRMKISIEGHKPCKEFWESSLEETWKYLSG